MQSLVRNLDFYIKNVIYIQGIAALNVPRKSVSPEKWLTLEDNKQLLKWSTELSSWEDVLLRLFCSCLNYFLFPIHYASDWSMVEDITNKNDDFSSSEYSDKNYYLIDDIWNSKGHVIITRIIDLNSWSQMTTHATWRDIHFCLKTFGQ